MPRKQCSEQFIGKHKSLYVKTKTPPQINNKTFYFKKLEREAN